MSKATVEDVKAMMQEVAEAIRAGNTKSMAIKYWVGEEEHSYTFSLETQDERDQALASILSLLGQLH